MRFKAVIASFLISCDKEDHLRGGRKVGGSGDGVRGEGGKGGGRGGGAARFFQNDSISCLTGRF